MLPLSTVMSYVAENWRWGCTHFTCWGFFSSGSEGRAGTAIQGRIMLCIHLHDLHREHPSRTTVLERSAIIIQRAYRFHRLQRVALEMKLRHPGWRKFAFQSFHLPLVEKALCRSWELTGSHRATESNDALVVRYVCLCVGFFSPCTC